MRVAVSGSIAIDYLMTFPKSFTDLIVPDQLDRLSLSFLVDGLSIRRGGVAANLCFGMGVLGLEPVLIGAVGKDFLREYGPWLADHGVDTSAVRVSEEQYTALFLCTTDNAENQIASFYPGAMGEAAEVGVDEIVDAVGDIDLLVVSPNDPAAMLRHTEEARAAGIPFMADPSQQLARLDGDSIRRLIDGAAYLVSNDYEAALIESKTGWSSAEVLGRVAVRVTTHGPDGCVIERVGETPIEVAAVPPGAAGVVDPTGVGDAFRAGFVTGRARGLELEQSAQIGAALATSALETVGTQEYGTEREVLLERLDDVYGDGTAEHALKTLA